MSGKEEERFQLSNICWICNKLLDVADNKVRDHCHVSGKYRSAAHWSCFKMTRKVPVNLVFIDSMQFMKSSLDLLVKNLSENFKYLSEECSGEYLRLVKEKGVYPYENMDSFDFLKTNCLTSVIVLVL